MKSLFEITMMKVLSSLNILGPFDEKYQNLCGRMISIASNTNHLNDYFISKLINFKKISSFDMNKGDLSDESLNSFAQLSGLKFLRLLGNEKIMIKQLPLQCFGKRNKNPFQSLIQTKKLENIEILDLGSTSVDDNSIQLLSNSCSSSLKVLSLEKTKIVSPSSLTKFENLNILNLSNNALIENVEEQFSFLDKIKKLSVLKIDKMNSHLSEQENSKIEKRWNNFSLLLSKIKTLHTLQFSFNFVSDESIVELKNLENLRVLDLTHSPLITFKSIKILIESLSNLKQFKIEEIKKRKLNFNDIMDLIKKGEKLPGVKLIDDKPIPNQTATPSKMEKRKKPWETKRDQPSSRSIPSRGEQINQLKIEETIESINDQNEKKEITNDQNETKRDYK